MIAEKVTAILTENGNVSDVFMINDNAVIVKITQLQSQAGSEADGIKTEKDITSAATPKPSDIDFSPEDIWTEAISFNIPTAGFAPSTTLKSFDASKTDSQAMPRYNITLSKKSGEPLSVIYSTNIANRNFKKDYDAMSSAKIREFFSSFGSSYTPTVYLVSPDTLVILPLIKEFDKQSSIKRQNILEWVASSEASYKGILDISRNANIPERLLEISTSKDDGGKDITIAKEIADIKKTMLGNIDAYLSAIKSYSGPYTYNTIALYFNNIKNDIDNIIYTNRNKILSSRDQYINEGSKVKQLNLIKADNEGNKKLIIPYDEAMKSGSELRLYIDRFIYPIIYNNDFILKGQTITVEKINRVYVDKAISEMKSGNVYESLLTYNTHVYENDGDNKAINLLLSALEGLGFFKTGVEIAKKKMNMKNVGLAIRYALLKVEKLAKDKDELMKYSPSTGKSLERKIQNDLIMESSRADLKEQREGGLHGLKGEGNKGMLIRNLLTKAKANGSSLDEEIIKRAVEEEMARIVERRKEQNLEDISDDDYDYIQSIVGSEASTYAAYDNASDAIKKDIEKDAISTNPIYGDNGKYIISVMAPNEELMERIRNRSYPLFSSVKRRIENLSKESGESSVSLNYTNDDGFNMSDVIPDNRQGIRLENKSGTIKKDVISVVDTYNSQIRSAINKLVAEMTASKDKLKNGRLDIEESRSLRADIDMKEQLAENLRGIIFRTAASDDKDQYYIKYADTLLFSIIMYKAKLGYDIDSILKEAMNNQKLMNYMPVLEAEGLKRRMQSISAAIKKAIDDTSTYLRLSPDKIFDNYQIIKNIVAITEFNDYKANSIVFESEINTTVGGNMKKELTVHGGYLYEQVGVVGSPEANNAIVAQQAADSARLAQIDNELAKLQATVQSLTIQRSQLASKVSTIKPPPPATPIVNVNQGMPLAARATPSSEYNTPQQGFTQAIHECENPIIKIEDKVYKVVGKNH